MSQSYKLKAGVVGIGEQLPHPDRILLTEPFGAGRGVKVWYYEAVAEEEEEG